MKLEESAIDAAGKLLLDHQFWADCKQFVSDIDGQTGLTGAEKSEKVKSDLSFIFGEVGSVFLTIGIELALAWVKSQSPQ